MAELLNDPRKREQLKAIVRDLHAGTDVRRIQRRFGTLIKGTSPEEIAAIEQELMREGLSPDDIRLVCDVHVAVFERELKRHKRAHALPGHPVHTYREENRVARKLLRRLRRTAREAARGRNTEAFAAVLDELSQIEVHYQRKENQLFPFLEQAGFDAPSKVMWGKHDEVRTELKRVREAFEHADSSALRARVRSLTRQVQTMIFMEERILLPSALRKLSDVHWVRIRMGEPAIGYAWVKPGDVWDPTVVMAGAQATQAPPPLPTTPQPASSQTAPATTPEAARPIDLSVGTLTRDQLDLILTNLPVEVSFVDEHDRVRYYSDTPDRTFPRSPGIIGREVRNCHPPKSVHVVEEIIAAFRNGKRDRAEFWIQTNGRFVHIVYSALRDDDGTYRGVLEVVYDATHLRSLGGERRLLEWDEKS